MRNTGEKKRLVLSASENDTFLPNCSHKILVCYLILLFISHSFSPSIIWYIKKVFCINKLYFLFLYLCLFLYHHLKEAPIDFISNVLIVSKIACLFVSTPTGILLWAVSYLCQIQTEQKSSYLTESRKKLSPLAVF